ncbi:MAG TPA: 23S rRNA (cytidine(2498)-2'-O)-methyltransferase RlmM [Rhodocyclaceae bacterium]|nr:23S rRNA (cytidine(2498)-2'-O)-methyltransferase RlmM [Rhodocyclaceae bacterium]
MFPAALNQAVLYCRPGFENECAAEICETAGELGVDGYARAKPDSGYVAYLPHEPAAMATLAEGLKWRRLCFARQLLFAAPLVGDLPVGDRITPLLQAVRALGTRFRDIWLETADTNEAKELSSFCKKFEKPFRIALEKAGLLAADDAELPRLHLFFLGSAACFVAISLPGNCSDWPMGIPRLRMPRAAPSRSTLKLAEAFMEFVGGHNADERLRAGQTAVDLGASPGGWTWQLAQREIHVTAIDNGPMDKALMAGGMVEHIKVDGFHYRPKRPVDWLVCDMVEKPSRIAGLVADWAAGKHCKEAIFNLKLPMKKRYDELRHCRDIIEAKLAAAGVEARLRFKQLYHDREEVTGHLRILKAR